MVLTNFLTNSLTNFFGKFFFGEFSDEFLMNYKCFDEFFLTNFFDEFVDEFFDKFFDEFLFGRFLLTYNLLTIASFRIGVPSILFFLYIGSFLYVFTLLVYLTVLERMYFLSCMDAQTKAAMFCPKSLWNKKWVDFGVHIQLVSQESGIITCKLTYTFLRTQV